MARINMTITLDPRIKELLKHRAESVNMSQSAYIEKAILSEVTFEEISRENATFSQELAAKLPQTSFDNAVREAVETGAPPSVEPIKKEPPVKTTITPARKTSKPMHME